MKEHLKKMGVFLLSFKLSNMDKLENIQEMWKRKLLALHLRNHMCWSLCRIATSVIFIYFAIIHCLKLKGYMSLMPVV